GGPGPQAADRPVEIPGKGRSAGRRPLGQLAKESQRRCQGGGRLNRGREQEALARDAGAFSRHDSGDRELPPTQKAPEAGSDLRSPVPLGTPSAWLFLIRLHACRAELRFARQDQYTLRPANRLKEIKCHPRGTTVSSRRGLVRAIGRSSGCAPAPP